MAHSLFSFIALCCFFALLCASPSSAMVRFGHQRHNTIKLNPSVDNSNASENFFTSQKLDHFDRQETRTWQQRYMVNDEYWNGDGPIFFQVGGEGAISSGYVTELEMVVYAQKFGALLVALEHRFYGESKPTDDLSTDNLRFLSSQQALADAAFFLTWFKEQYNATSSSIVTFGCSYPGNLAAWFRMKYPHVTVGAVASSAPVQATLDFYKYLDVVDQSLTYYTGPQCDAIISNATSMIQSMLASKNGTKALEKTFKLCAPMESDKDVSTFMSSLMGNWMGTVQYNGETGPITAEYLCDMMLNSTDTDLARYAAVNDLFLQATGQDCLDVSYNSSMVDVLNTTQAEAGVGIRSWTYQTCAEFAYFQTTDSKYQPFGDLVPLSFYTDMCTEAFGKMDTGSLVDETNALYGGSDLPSEGLSNLLFVNGNIDPWHALGVTSNISSSVNAILIDGTAHCANIMPPSPEDLPSVKKARLETAKHIAEWLGLTE